MSMEWPHLLTGCLPSYSRRQLKWWAHCQGVREARDGIFRGFHLSILLPQAMPPPQAQQEAALFKAAQAGALAGVRCGTA